MPTLPDITVPEPKPKAGAVKPVEKPKNKLKLLNPEALRGFTGLRMSQEQAAQTSDFDLLMQELAPLDPISRAIAKRPLERMLKITLPDPEEWEIQKLNREKAFMEGRKALIQSQVDDIQASIWDNQEALAEVGITPDTLLKDPQAWIDFVNDPQIGGRISMGDLMRIGLVETPEQAAASKLKGQAEEARERTSLAENKLKEAGRINEVATGSGPFGALTDDLASSVEKARGADMTFDIDTPEGSAAALDFYEQGKAGPIGQVLGPQAWAKAVLQRLKGDIADNLEGLGEGGLLGVSGDAGVDDDAVFNMQTLIRAAANDLGVAPADLLKTELSLNYTGLDDLAYGAAVLKRAGGDPVKAQAFLSRYGQRVQTEGL